MLRSPIAWLLICSIAVAVGCNSDADNNRVGVGPPVDPGNSVEETPEESTSDPATPEAGAETGTSGNEEPIPEMTPKEAIALQFELLKKQDVEELKKHFTERLQEKITAEAVAAAQDQAGKMTMDELVATFETDESQGKETARVYMPGGRTLTTLIKVDGHWLADTVWFQ